MAEPKMFTTWDGLKIHAEKADKDVNGNSLELGISDNKIVSIGGKAVAGAGGGGGADLPPYSDEDKAVLANQAGTMSWDKGFATTSYVENKINGFIVNAPLEGGGSAGSFKTLNLCYDDSLDLVVNEAHPGWTRQLAVKTPLPVPDSGYSDEGKILRVGLANELEWVNSSAVVDVDNTTMQYNQYGSLEVKLPIPDPTNNDGKVLTVEHNSLTNTDDVVWKDAGGGGGGSDIPEFTVNDENKVLGVIVDREYNFNTHQNDITGTRLGWVNGIPEFPEWGSAGEWGVEPVVKIVKKLNQDTGYYDIITTEAGFAGCPYNTFGPDDMYGSWQQDHEWEDYGEHGYTITNNTYVAEINNDWFINFGYLKDGYDAEEGDPPYHPDVTSVLFNVKHHGGVIPFTCIEFINMSGKSLTVSVESEETGDEPYGETLVPISENGNTVNNVIPNNTFVQISVLGHGYTIKTSTTLPAY